MRAKIRNARRAAWVARRERVGRGVAGSDRVQLSVYRTAKHMYAQLFDPASRRTIGTVSTRSKAIAEGLASTGNVEGARRVGKAVAELARRKNIEQVVFNRNGFLYHGRVKAVADAAREAGLQF